MSESQSLWQELKRRHVVRAGIVHVVLFWLLAQVAEVVGPYLGIVSDPIRWTIIAGIALFPVTLLAAWFLEHPWHRYTGRRIFTDLLVILVIAVTAAAWVVRHLPQTGALDDRLAVLPFSFERDNGAEQALSRALAFEVISLLMRSGGLNVTAYESASSPLLEGLDARGVAQRLEVDHLLSGTLRLVGDRVQIRAVLQDSEGNETWREEFSETTDQLFVAQEELAAGVAGLLLGEQEILSVEAVAAQRCDMPSDAGALQRYYTARHYLELRNDENLDLLRESIALLEGLIVEYPKFAEARSGLAWALNTQEYYDPEVEWETNYDRIRQLAAEAADLCPDLGEAVVFLPNEFDHPNPFVNRHQQFEMAMNLQPDKNEMADKFIRVLRQTGRRNEAEAIAREVWRRNPLSVRSIKTYAFALQANQKYDEAIALQEEAASMGSKTPIFARQLKAMHDCDLEVECVLSQMPFLEPMHDVLRVALQTPVDEASTEAAIEALETFLQQTRLLNLGNAMACWFDHLTPAYYIAWDMVEHETDWFWPNTWGRSCGNVWADPRFPGMIEEQGFLEYWREKGWADACRPEGDSFICEETES